MDILYFLNESERSFRADGAVLDHYSPFDSLCTMVHGI